MATNKAEELKANKAKQKEALDSARKKVQDDRNNSDSVAKSLSDIAKAVGIKNSKLQSSERSVDIQLLSKGLDSDISKNTSEKISKLFEETEKGGFLNRRESKKQSKLLKKVADGIKDTDEKKIVQEQISKLDELISADKKIITGLKTSISALAAPLGGVIAGLTSDSPFVGAATFMAGNFIKEKLAKRKARKEEFQKLATETLAIEEQRAFESERDKLNQNNAEDINEKETENAEKITVAADKVIDAVDRFKKKVDPKEAEFQKEQINRDSENAEKTGKIVADALDKKGSKKKEDGGFSIFGKGGILGKLKSGIMGLLGAGSLSGFFGGLTSMFSGLGAGIMKFIKKIPFIGAIVAGVNVFNAIGDLPDDATLGEKIFTGITTAAESILDFFTSIPIKIIDFLFDTDIEGFIESQGGIVQTISKSVTSFFSMISDTIEKALDSLSKFVEDTIRSIPLIGEDLGDEIYGKKNVVKSEQELNSSLTENSKKLQEKKPDGFLETGVDFLKDVSPFFDSRAERDAKILKDMDEQNQLLMSKQSARRDAQIQATDKTNSGREKSNVVQMNNSQASVNNVNQSVASVRPNVSNKKGPMLDRVQA